MTSPAGVTSQKCIILSVNDPRITSLKFRPGDRFFFIDEDMKSYHPALAMMLREKPVILEIESILLDIDGSIVYKLMIPGKLKGEEIPWVVNDEFIPGRLLPIGNDASNIRFVEYD